MRRQDDHVVFVAGGFRCTRCGTHRKIGTPINVHVFVDESRLFLAQHRQCSTTSKPTTDDTDQVAA